MGDTLEARGVADLERQCGVGDQREHAVTHREHGRCRHGADRGAGDVEE